MTVSFLLWVEVQTAISSIFMVKAMWNIWKTMRETLGPDHTGTLLALLFALHGVAGFVAFIVMGVISAIAEPRIPLVVHLMGLLAFATIPLMLIKVALTWLGEGRGGTTWWRIFLVLSALWAAAAIVL